MIDCEMYSDIGMVMVLVKKDVQGQIVLNVRRRLLTLQSQHDGIITMGKIQVQKLMILSERTWLLTAQSQNGIAYEDIHGRLFLYWYNGNQNRELCWINRYEVRVWVGKDVWLCACCFLTWFRYGIFALKDTPSVEVKVEILMRISCLKWYCYFEVLKDKCNKFMLQLTFQSQLDGILVDYVVKSWITLFVMYEGLMMVEKKDAGYQRKIMKFLMINWRMKKQELTLKSQWPAMKKMGSAGYFANIEGLDCCFIYGIWADDEGKLGFGIDEDYLYGLDERVGVKWEWNLSCIGRMLLVGWRLDVVLMEAYFGVLGFGWNG
ncbi:hypothetical protein QVD17_32417 [Tagetes erecta]|uniref:Uncharacterized protein n=1 Tax=Tagetes erecta TaxID=13708 RepID=A0AAD8NQ44_TARER|nr:hypothetical protein QVD17_32417 [Tagetes erecta]